MEEKAERNINQELGVLDILFKDTWLSTVLSEEIDPVDPNTEMGSDESLVGDMSDLEIKLYSHSAKLEMMAKMTMAKGDFESDSHIKSLAIDLGAQSEVLKKLMWTIIDQRLGHPDFHVGVRKNFKVSKIPKKSGPSFSILDIIKPNL